MRFKTSNRIGMLFRKPLTHPRRRVQPQAKAISHANGYRPCDQHPNIHPFAHAICDEGADRPIDEYATTHVIQHADHAHRAEKLDPMDATHSCKGITVSNGRKVPAATAETQRLDGAPQEPQNLSELFGTSDPDEQFKLAYRHAQPTVSLVITVDPRINRAVLTPICATLDEMPIPMIQRMLQLAQEELTRLIVQQAVEQARAQAETPHGPGEVIRQAASA